MSPIVSGLQTSNSRRCVNRPDHSAARYPHPPTHPPVVPSASGVGEPSGRQLRRGRVLRVRPVGESMQRVWTVLLHDGPDHLGLWLNQALVELVDRANAFQMDGLPSPSARPLHCPFTASRCRSLTNSLPFIDLPLPFFHCLFKGVVHGHRSTQLRLTTSSTFDRYSLTKAHSAPALERRESDHGWEQPGEQQ